MREEKPRAIDLAAELAKVANNDRQRNTWADGKKSSWR